MDAAVNENLLVGRNPIREALRAGRDIEKLLVLRGELSGSAREIVQKAREQHIIVQEVEKARLDELAQHHQGLIAFASAYAYSTVEAMLAEAERRHEEPFLILLDGVTDPHNLGAIIRSAECVGAHGVIVPDRRSVGLTPAAVKASAGAVEHMKVARVTNLSRTIEELKERNIWTYAMDMDGEDYERVNFKGGVALVVGSEGEGVSRLVADRCDKKVSLPMAGHIDSLNASVAAGVMMYRVLSSRKA
ncbi:MAG: 23S rRNA (guanosine(2251)-2'-O)-methyltransferase RlmB [Clostridiales bacterium]|nr:23S rRNA (guanosine(2251)-2'-O)-methyltransferase RlmB [Clostridiales bacterium]